jgi:hypothetical protein
MTSPDETVASKSPPFAPTFETTNNVLFGAPSNQQSNTGKHIIFLYSGFCRMRATDLNCLYKVHNGKLCLNVHLSKCFIFETTDWLLRKI